MDSSKTARALALALALSACSGSSQTALQLVLTPTPEIAPEPELVGAVKQLQVVVGATDGLLGVTTEGPTAGGGQALDVDGDGKLDVRFTAPPFSERLPVLQLDLEANTGRALWFRVYGLPEADAPLASAVAQGFSGGMCTQGKVCQVGVPFNLKPSLAAPRVIVVSPPDGKQGVPKSVVAVTAVLSTLVDADSARANSRVLGPSGANATVQVIVDEVTFSVGGETARRTNLTFQLASPLEEGWHVIQIGPGLVSAAGRRFDQDPKTPAEDGFVSRFETQATLSRNGCSLGDCDPGYECDPRFNGCVPVRVCPSTCVPGYVCDASQAVCVEDCRVLPLCPGRCQEGVCR